MKLTKVVRKDGGKVANRVNNLSNEVDEVKKRITKVEQKIIHK